jgi:hypothetical protein
MDSPSATRASGFPPQIDLAEIEARCARESFTWGPQAFWLFCGLIWLFYFFMGDIPELARNTLLFAAGSTLLAALAVWYEMRRRNRRTILYPLGGRIGVYRGNAFQYSFSRGEMVRERPDFFGWIMVLFKLLLPMLMLMAIVGVVMYDALKHSGPQPWQGIALFVYLMLFALFGFVALYRSHISLAFFWIPNSKGKTDKRLYLHPWELRKIEEGDSRPLR